jgi:hypothetical protein
MSSNIISSRLALAMTLPRHGSGFVCLLCWRCTHLRSPYVTPATPSTQRHGECQNAQVGKNHLHRSCPLRPPTAVGWHETNRGGLYAPSAIKTSQKMQQTMPALPGSALVLPGDVDDDWAQLCARSRWHQGLGSPLRLPRKFQGTGGTGSARTRRWPRATCMFQAL